MDPNVQVAFVTVLGVLISTSGVVAAAIINNQRERAKAASAGVDAALDEKDILQRVVSLIAENDRKEATIRELKGDVRVLEEEIRMLKAENVNLMLKIRHGGEFNE